MLYVVVEEHSGILLNIYRCLTGDGYKIVSNQFGKRAGDNKTFVKLEIENGTLPLPPELEGKLLNISGCEDILYQEPTAETGETANASGSSHSNEQLKEKVAQVAKEIVANFSNVGPVVNNFTQSFQGTNNSSIVFMLGHQVGAMIYKKDYALGKPLKLEKALKRMLSQAISSFGKVSCNDRMISIDNSIFCNTANPNSRCDFTKGFMTGFLHQSPTTKEAKVENISCRCQGQMSCSFEFR
ncbi:hypothetical protein [Aliikangiella sp. G2MR2-5]|uniref:hypothetical protein n=1 Tax=Aliikangiella sp. G2MR2-5 TaxID=2788943 RepID=UPI0018A94F5E|nr:hypothetical protein [Aliikangiella sp. G2MR2-5]